MTLIREQYIINTEPLIEFTPTRPGHCIVWCLSDEDAIIDDDCNYLLLTGLTRCVCNVVIDIYIMYCTHSIMFTESF